MKPNLLLPLFAVLFTAGVSFGINALAATFAEPASAPPADNAYAPLDTGPNTNNKNGILGVTGFTSHSTTFLALDSGNVGIGTADPQTKLDVAGTITATGFKLSTAGAGAGKVLMSDADGDATWEGTPSTSGNLCGARAVAYNFSTQTFFNYDNVSDDFPNPTLDALLGVKCQGQDITVLSTSPYTIGGCPSGYTGRLIGGGASVFNATCVAN